MFRSWGGGGLCILRFRHPNLKGRPVALPSSTGTLERQVLAHFGGNLVVVPTVHDFEWLEPHAIQAYGQVRTLATVRGSIFYGQTSYF